MFDSHHMLGGELAILLSLTLGVDPLPTPRPVGPAAPEASDEAASEPVTAGTTPPVTVVRADRPPTPGWVGPVVPVASAQVASKHVAVSMTPTVTTVGATAADESALADALARFRSNGLPLPDLDVRFFDDEADCGGHYGLFQQQFTPWRILVCSDLAFVPTHELAHAWEAANLSDEDRDRYLEARGLGTWSDPASPWKERGVEDAAFMIQQNLTVTSAPLASPRSRERMAAYELLTGRSSPLSHESSRMTGRTR